MPVPGMPTIAAIVLRPNHADMRIRVTAADPSIASLAKLEPRKTNKLVVQALRCVRTRANAGDDESSSYIRLEQEVNKRRHAHHCNQSTRNSPP